MFSCQDSDAHGAEPGARGGDDSPERAVDSADPVVNCVFPVAGRIIPAEHGYAFYGALKQLWPDLQTYDWLQVGPVTPLGRRAGKTWVGRDATLLCRAPVSQLPTLFALAETTHTLDQGHLALGRPLLSQLQPALVLYSPFVTVKVHDGGQSFYPWDALDLARFLAGIEARLAMLGITQGRAHVDVTRPRWLRIKDGGASGYPVAVVGLTADESLWLQATGLGGRRKMGCGVLVRIEPPRAQGGNGATAVRSSARS